MTTATALDLAILALDAYNRGRDNRGIVVPNSNSIGLFNFDEDSAVGAFYGASYTNGSDTIIAYRGTDDPWSDATSGWPQGLGFQTQQAVEAARFYRTVNGGSFAPNSNITLTARVARVARIKTNTCRAS